MRTPSPVDTDRKSHLNSIFQEGSGCRSLQILWAKQPSLNFLFYTYLIFIYDMHHLEAIEFKKFRDEPAMAAPRKTFGAHDDGGHLEGDFFQALDPFPEFLRLHICLIAT